MENRDHDHYGGYSPRIASPRPGERIPVVMPGPDTGIGSPNPHHQHLYQQQQQQQQRTRLQPKPTMDEWGGGLGDILAPRPPAPVQAPVQTTLEEVQRERRARLERQRGGGGVRAAERGEGGGGGGGGEEEGILDLASVLGPRPVRALRRLRGGYPPPGVMEAAAAIQQRDGDDQGGGPSSSALSARGGPSSSALSARGGGRGGGGGGGGGGGERAADRVGIARPSSGAPAHYAREGTGGEGGVIRRHRVSAEEWGGGGAGLGEIMAAAPRPRETLRSRGWAQAHGPQPSSLPSGRCVLSHVWVWALVRGASECTLRPSGPQALRPSDPGPYTKCSSADLDPTLWTLNSRPHTRCSSTSLHTRPSDLRPCDPRSYAGFSSTNLNPRP